MPTLGQYNVVVEVRKTWIIYIKRPERIMLLLLFGKVSQILLSMLCAAVRSTLYNSRSNYRLLEVHCIIVEVIIDC